MVSRRSGDLLLASERPNAAVLLRPFRDPREGPMTGFTETEYRSHFTPLATFAEFSPAEYLSLVIGLRPKEQQLNLF
jgi:hypothetical protein